MGVGHCFLPADRDWIFFRALRIKEPLDQALGLYFTHQTGRRLTDGVFPTGFDPTIKVSVTLAVGAGRCLAIGTACGKDLLTTMVLMWMERGCMQAVVVCALDWVRTMVGTETDTGPTKVFSIIILYLGVGCVLLYW